MFTSRAENRLSMRCFIFSNNDFNWNWTSPYNYLKSPLMPVHSWGRGVGSPEKMLKIVSNSLLKLIIFPSFVLLPY